MRIKLRNGSCNSQDVYKRQRVDSDVVDNLIVKEDKAKDFLEADKQEVLSVIFKSQLPQIEKTEFNVMAQALGENASPVMICLLYTSIGFQSIQNAPSNR